MKSIIFAMALLFLFNVEHQSLLNSTNTFQKAEVIIHDDHLSKIIGGAKFIEGFCVAVGFAGIAAFFFPPLTVPAYVAGSACALYAGYVFFN